MANLRLTADSSQLVSEVKKAKEALKTAKTEYKAASSEAEIYGTKEGQLVNKIRAANQIQATRTTTLQTYQKAIHQLQTEINNWEREEKELIQKLKEAQQANDTAKIKEYEAALAKLRTQIKNNQTELTSVNRSYNDLRTEMAQTAKQTNDLQNELDDLSNTFEEVETISEDAGDNMDSMGDGAEGAATAVFSLQDALSTASGYLKDFGELIDGITNKFEELIVNGIQKTGEALVNLGKFSIDKGMSFEESMSQLMATMGLDKTSDVYAPLKETAEYYGRTTKYTATEAAQALNILAQSGLTYRQQMDSIGTVLNLASAGALDLSTAAKYVTGSVKGFGDEMRNASYYADLMAKGASLANTDTNMLGTAFSTAAANANAYGQTADSLTLSLLRLAEQNVIGTDASTALNRVMMDLYTPTSTASKVLDELGISAYDANHNAKDLNVVIDELNAVLKTYNEESQNTIKNQIFSTYGLNAFNKMTVTSTEKVNEFKDALSGAGGAAEDMAKTMINNLQGDLYAVQSAAEGFGIKIFEGIVPGLRQAVQGITKYISELTNNFKNNGMGQAIDKISKAFSNFATQIPALLQKHGPTIIRIFNSIIDIVVILLDSLPALIDSALPNLMSIIENLSQKLPAFLEKVMPKIIDGVGWLASNFPILIASLYGLQGLSGAGAGLLDFGGVIAGIGMAAKVAGTSLGAIVSAAAPVIAAIGAIVTMISLVISSIITAYATSETYRSYFAGIIEDLKQRFGKLVSMITDSIVQIMNDLGFEVSSAKDALGVILQIITTFATITTFAIGQAVSFAITYIELFINSFMSCYNVISNLLKGFIALLKGDFDTALIYVEEFVNSIGEGFSNVWSTARESCSNFSNDFGDFMVALQDVASGNPVKISIESDLNEESFKQDLRLVASWGLPGWDESKFGPLFKDQYTKSGSAKRNGYDTVAIQNGIDIANAAINNWQGNKTFNINNITNSPVYNWNTSDEGDENVFIKMTRETEAYGKYMSG